MARQHPRKGRHTRWIATSRMPQELVEQGVFSWAVAHQQAHPWCWACGAPGVNTITVQSRQLNPGGGNVTFYTLCKRCTDDSQVQRRVVEDLERDEAQAEQIRNNCATRAALGAGGPARPRRWTRRSDGRRRT